MEAADEDLDLRGVLWMLSSAVLFAGNTLLVRAAALSSDAADGWMATLFRGFFGVLLLLVFFSNGRGLDWRRMFSSKLVIARGLIGCVGIVCFYITIVQLGAARAIVINLTYPLFATVIAAFWLKEKFSLKTGIWLFAAMGGLVIFLSDGGLSLSVSFYDWIGLLGAVAAGFVVVLIRQLRHTEHPATIYGAQATSSLLIGLLFLGEVPELNFSGGSYLIIGAVVVTFGQLIMTSAYQRLSIAKGASLQMTLPIFTAAGAFVFFDEKMHLAELIGAVVVIFSVWRVAVRKRRV